MKIKEIINDIKMLIWYLLTEPFRFINRLVVRTGKKITKPIWLVYFFITLSILFFILKDQSKQNLFMFCALISTIYYIWIDGKFRKVYRDRRNEKLREKYEKK